MTTPEQKAREQIDALLEQAEWHICDTNAANIHAGLGVAYRAKPKARASANCWVDRGDLTSILTLSNIAEQNWVRD